jgi:hypothetical protein
MHVAPRALREFLLGSSVMMRESSVDRAQTDIQVPPQTSVSNVTVDVVQTFHLWWIIVSQVETSAKQPCKVAGLQQLLHSISYAQTKHVDHDGASAREESSGADKITGDSSY